MELVKEEVHRALQAFSTRPLKGDTRPPLPRDLLRPYDTTRDGRITYLEFEAGLRGLGVGLTGGEAKALARDVDGGDTGLVDRERFEASAMGGWGREATAAAAAPTESVSATGHRNGGKNTVHDRGAPPGGTPPRGGKRVSWREEGEQQQVEPRRTCDFDAEPGEGRANGQHGRSYKVGDGGGKAWKAVLRSGSAYADRDHQGDRATVVSRREGGMEENPHASTRGIPPPPPVAQKMKEASNAYAAGKSRGSAVSFEQWHRRMTAGGDGGHAAKVPADGVSASGRGKAKGRARSARERADSLNTLRSLLRGEGPDGESVVEGGAGNHWQWFESRDRGNGNGPYRQQHRRSSSRREEHALPGAAGDGAGRCGGTSGGERRGRAGVRKSLAPPERCAIGPFSATDSASPGGGRRAGAAAHDADGEDTSASLRETERAHRHAGRAESILRIRSRGDLVGLRRALAKADPSASGVISQREMERVILRRFGSGFSDDEARGLAARYGKEIRGHAMVDYGRLFDSLEAKEAGLCGDAALRWEQPSVKKREKHAGSTTPREILPAAAGSRSSNRRTGCARTLREGDGDGSVCEAPPEESQLARRAQAKTLALLDLHGTRSVDQVFGLIDPGGWFG